MGGEETDERHGRGEEPPEGGLSGQKDASQSGDERRTEADAIERYARSLIEYTFDLILLLDRSGDIVFASPSARRLLGYDPESVAGRNVFAFLHPDDLAWAVEFYRTGVDRRGYSPYLMVRVRHHDGSWRWFEAVGNNLLEDPLVRGIVVSARDITEHRRLEEDLRRSEAYFRYITENTHDIISVLDREGRLRYVSPSIKRISGYEPEELLGRSPFELLHPEDTDRVVAVFSQGIENDLPSATAEYRWLRKDGSWQVFEAFGINALDNPAIEGIVVHARDITERKRWEEALRESEEKYRLIYDFTGEAIFTYDTDMRLIGVNRKACELIGYGEHELLGKNVLELNILHPDDHARAIDDIRRLSAGETVRDELRFVRRDGSVAIGSVTGAPLYDREGRVIAFTNVAHDVTERKREEWRLDELRRCLLELGADPMENIARIVAVAGRVMGEGALRYCRLDKGGLTVLYPSGEKIERISDREAAAAYACYEDMLADAVEPRVIEDLEGTAYARDPDAAREGFRSFLGYPARLREKTVGMLCLFGREAGSFAPPDMHLMGMLARALAIEEERLVHVESIRHFVDIASHELRTPLSIIKGYADAFLHGDLAGIDGESLEKIRIINGRADKMAKTIDDLLDLSRIERGLFAVEKREAAVPPLLEHAVGQMREKGAGQEFEVRIGEGVRAHALDAEKIADALIILLDNAVKYSPPSSPVLLEARREGGGLLISVYDRGPGIPEKDREVIFERFHQLEDAAHHASSGLGLGLFIAREIARGHGGSIWCEAREGGGSVFRMLIP
ncbi:MAG: PAS domain S-box protein [Actinomycetota bacterium]|nr:PAS domain S-box protein [Actinomycetota bacterium]